MSAVIKPPKPKQRPVVGVGVCVFRQRKNQQGDNEMDIVLLQRPNGEWTLPGGKQEWGETFRTCGIREIKEETGLHITLHPNFCAVSDYITIDDTKKYYTGKDTHFTLLTLAGWAETDTIIMENTHDIADVKWFDVNHALTLPMWQRTLDIIEMARDTMQLANTP